MVNETPVLEPYVGPRPFEQNESDSARFFGRSRETQEIVSLIFGHPLTLVYAQSGAGKTSLINASITPTLKREGFDVLPPTRVGGILPKGIAMGEIGNLYVFNALLNIVRNANPQSLLTKSLTNYLEERPRTTDPDGLPLPRVMIFDQFEELFTYTPENWREQREGFFLQIMKALEADPLLRIVFVIREDFLAQLDPYARNLSERLRTRYRLERLQEDAALHAIKDPLVSTTRSFAPGVAEGLVKELLFTRTTDAAGKMVEIVGQYVEPVQLQVVCVTLWSDLEPDTTVITQGHLQNFNVNIALSDFYETAVEAAAKETGVEERLLRDWFGKTLITSMGTRSTVFRGENSTGGIPNNTVDYLESRHIIRAEFRAGVRWYELTHDRFIEAIMTNNKEWFTKRREAIGNPVTEPAREWNRLDKDEGSLLRGALLDELKEWAEKHPTELDDLEHEFLDASKLHYQRDLEAKAKSEKRLRALTVGLAAALIVAAFAAITALNRATFANEQANIASTQAALAEEAADEARNQEALAATNAQLALEEARAAEIAESEARAGKLAIQSISSLNTDPQLSLLLAVEANRIRHIPETDDTLRQALEASQVKVILSLQNNVNALAFSPNGKHLVTGDTAGVVTLWDAATNVVIKTWGGDENNNASVNILVFDPSGISFATGRSDGSVAIWPMETLLELDLPEPFFRLNGLTSNIRSLVFSPDGNLIAAASEDGSALVWSIDKVDTAVSLKGHSAQVNSLAFNPAGDRIVTGSSDSTAIVWDAGTGRRLFILRGHTAGINAVGFTPDGNFIATASDDTTVRLWSVENGQEVATLGHTGNVTNMVFAPNNSLLITVSSDNTVWLWSLNDAISDTPTTIATGHEDRVTSLTMSPDGQYLATTSADMVKLWKIPTGELQAELQHSSIVKAAAFTPDSGLLATTSSDNKIRIWNISGGGAQRALQGHEQTVWDIAINPSGTLMATRGQDATLLWDFEQALNSEGDPASGTAIDEASEVGFGVDFSSEGNLLATSSIKEEEDGVSSKVSIIDVTKPDGENLIWTHSFPAEAVFNLAFAPNGNLLAISLGDPELEPPNSDLHLWDISADREVGEITSGNRGATFGVAFNEDGSLLATGIYNDPPPGGVRIWRVEDILAGKAELPAAELFSDEAAAVPTAFSPTGNILASGNSDGTVRLWDVTTVLSAGDTSELAILRGHDELILGLAFSPDGRLLASSDIQGNIRVWDVIKAVETRGANAEVLGLQGQGDAIYSVAFSPDGNWLISAGDDPAILVWPLNFRTLINLACRRVTRNLTQIEWETYFGSDKPYKRTCLNLPYHSTALDAMVEQGNLLAREDKTEEALEVWNKVKQLDPERNLDTDQLLAGIYLVKGDQYIADGDYDKALEVLRKAVGLDPSLGFDPERALTEKLWEASGQFIDTGNFDKAAKAISKALELDPTLDADKAQKSAYVSVAIGEYDQALEALRKAKDLDPSLELDPEAKLKEMVADSIIKYVVQGEYDQAKKSLERSDQRGLDIYEELILNQMYSDEVETQSGDLWVFDGKAGQTISIQMKDNNSGLDTYLTLVGPSGVTMTNDDFDGTNSQIDHTLEDDGIYFIVTSGFGGGTGAYTLTITEGQ